VVIFLILPVIIPSLLFAQLDLEQDVLVIPDTHDAEPYKWKKSGSTRGYDLRMEYGTLIAGNDSEFTFSIKTKVPKTISDVHVFITDNGLNVFRHLRPESGNGKHRFVFNVPSHGKYRFEFVFKSAEDGWINLRKDISIKESVKQDPSLIPPLPKGDEEGIYSVNVKLFPEKVYAEHVVTFLYEISHNGVPVEYPEKTDGVDILITSWDKSRKEFICAGSRQNVDGQIAVSIVFMKPGKHRVFAEFKHNGAVRAVQTDIDVLEEPEQKGYGF